MNDVRWSDADLRSFVEVESRLNWWSDASDREEERARFRVEAAHQIVPRIQAGLMERVGIPTAAEGIAAVALDLVLELSCEDEVRRWLLVSTEPWVYLASWMTREIVKSYKATVGKKRPSDKVLKEIERANQ